MLACLYFLNVEVGDVKLRKKARKKPLTSYQPSTGAVLRNIGLRSGQNSPVPPEQTRLVSILWNCSWTYLNVLNLPYFANEKTRLMAISVEKVRMAKSRQRKNQSERSNKSSILPCHKIKEGIIVWRGDNCSYQKKFTDVTLALKTCQTFQANKRLR